ncbi:uracil permease-like protein [Hypoxylon rubiginosum]|uniref:Uracil permease-like protein n=1 Tax=Hypoxylon rubiginosum TaxID=110542 RepID=A0ACC0CYU1_9PEZI|nr:uracil permease-like protein [Hypoxylon rubiginosum]
MPFPTKSSYSAKAAQTRESLANAFSSWENFKLSLQVKDTLAGESTRYIDADPLWMNEDLEPTPPEKRTWDAKTYVLFYFGLAFGNWSLGSTMIGIGLSWWQAIIVIFISQLISAVAMIFNTRAASVYHIGYPAVSRAVFGMYGSYYFVGARAILAVVWYGLQLYSGASHVSNMLRAVFGDSYNNIPNHIPASAGITTKKMLSFFIFWIIHFFFCFFRPYRLTKFFWFKGFIIIPAVIGVFVYCMIETKGNVNYKLQHTSIAASTGWAIMHAINSGLGNTATLITNQPDIARWSKKHRSAMWAQMIKPFAVTISATFGILSTAGINGKWGLELWNPWDLLDAIQDHHNGSGARFAIFLAALTWTVGILGTNIAANMISFGSDAAMLFPRYIDMKRGFFIVEFLAFAIAPWKILASASVFTTFLSGYGLFMASVAAIMIADYYFIIKGNVFTAWLYNPRKSNLHYRYHKGWNIQALIAYVVGIALPFPGFVASLGAKGVNDVGLELYYLGWILSFVTSFVLYIAICKVWPNPNQRAIQEQGLGWEEASHVMLQGEDPDQKDSSEGFHKSPEVVGVKDLDKSNGV